MRHVQPEVFGPVAKPSLDWEEIRAYLSAVGGEAWADRRQLTDVTPQQIDGAGDTLVEFGGRLCYRSWEPGLNANVSRVRVEQEDYLGNVLKSGHGCYDDQTEVLTAEGWMPWPEVSGSESFVTLNLDTGVIELQEATARIRKPWDGKMVQYDKRGVQLLVTPDHRMVHRRRTRAGWQDLQVASAETLMSTSHRISLVAGKWSATEYANLDQARLLGFIAGDGNVRGSGIHLNVRKRRKIEWVERIAPLAGVQVSHPGKGGLGVVQNRAIRADAADTYDANGNRKVPDAIMAAGPQTILAFIQGLVEADGHTTRGYTSISTASKTLADQIQEMGVKAGIAVSVSRAERDAYYTDGTKVVYTVSLLSERFQEVRINWTHDRHGKDMRFVDYEGEVHCVSVPNGTLYVRRHGKACWSGNSVTEHANYSFVLHNVSRVVTHEFVRHRAGVAISQESMRFVRLTDLPFWFPDWAKGDWELYERCLTLLTQMEQHQVWMAEHFGLDDEGVPFTEKKAKTSFMRRFAPIGVATGLLTTLNIRSIRHIIYMRTALGAEEEIRIVCDQIAEKMLAECPGLMQDYSPNEDKAWIPEWLKV